MRVYIEGFLFDEDQSVVDIQVVRSPKSSKIYVSKEDINLVTNCSVDSLPFFYQAHIWVQGVAFSEHTDPFVVKHRNNYMFSQKYHTDYTASLQSEKFVGLKESNEPLRINWSVKVTGWWNNFLNTTGVRRKQLFLRSKTGTGKSTLIENLIGVDNMGCVYYPDCGKWMLNGYNSRVHKVILFEEFSSQYYPLSMLKRLCEGRTYAYPQKFGMARNIRHDGPIIFVTNDNFDMDDAMKSRLLIVDAEEAYFKTSSSIWTHTINFFDIETMQIREVSGGSFCELVSLLLHAR